MTTWAQVGCIWRQARARAAAHWYGWLMGQRGGTAVPAGTTHVLEHLPAFLVDDPGPEDAAGWWEIATLGNYLAGADEDQQPCLFGPGDTDEKDLTAFAEEALGYPVMLLVRFKVNIGRGTAWSTEPAFCVGPRPKGSDGND